MNRRIPPTYNRLFPTLKTRFQPEWCRLPEPSASETRVAIYIDLQNLDGNFNKILGRFSGFRLANFQTDATIPALLQKKLLADYYEALSVFIANWVREKVYPNRPVSCVGTYLYTKQPYIELETVESEAQLRATIAKVNSTVKFGYRIDLERNINLRGGQGLYLRTGYHNLRCADYLADVIRRDEQGKPLKKDRGVDAYLTSELISHAAVDHFDVAILGSRDGDFLPLVHHLTENLGKHVFTCGFRESYRKPDKSSPLVDKRWDKISALANPRPEGLDKLATACEHDICLSRFTVDYYLNKKTTP